MNDNDVLLTINWRVADVRTAFINKYGRQPSNRELKDCVENLDLGALEDMSIERGWEVIDSTAF